jgi:hypothetical protein
MRICFTAHPATALRRKENEMKKILLALAATAVVATPALAKPIHHHRAVDPTRGLYMQAPYQGQAPYGLYAQPPSQPAIMFKGKPFTDPDPSIYNYLIRTYREEGTG